MRWKPWSTASGILLLLAVVTLVCAAPKERVKERPRDLSAGGGQSRAPRNAAADGGKDLPVHPAKAKPAQPGRGPRIVRLRDGTLVPSDKLEELRGVQSQNDRTKRSRRAQRELLKHMVLSQRRPADRRVRRSPAALRNYIRLLEPDVGPLDVASLTERNRNDLIRELEQAKTPWARERIYGEAFECGIPPESLLALATPQMEAEIAEASRTWRGSRTPQTAARTLTRIQAMPDSNAKGRTLAQVLLEMMAADDARTGDIARTLQGMPSPAAAALLCGALSRADLAPGSRTQIVTLLGRNRSKIAHDSLLVIMQQQALPDPAVNEACRWISIWAHEPAVAQIVTQRLLQHDGKALVFALDPLWGLENGASTLRRLATDAASEPVRSAALHLLRMHAFHEHASTALWAIATDEKLSEDLRATALGYMRSSAVRRFPERSALLKAWAKGQGPLATSAKRQLVPPEERPIPRREKRSKKAKLLVARRMALGEVRAIENLAHPSELEKKRLAQLKEGIATLEGRLQAIDPSGAWRNEESVRAQR